MQDVSVPGQVPAGCVALRIDVEEVVDPPLGVPTVETLTVPALKKVAGPYATSSEGSDAVTGVEEPLDGRVTLGLGPKGGWAPPKREMVAETP
jgi:hypothetical protein